MADVGPIHSVGKPAIARGHLLGAIAGRFTARILRCLESGTVTFILPDSTRIEARGASAGPHAHLSVRRWRGLWRLLTGGDLGLAEAYIDGDWWTPDLKAVLAFGMRNDRALQHTFSSLSILRAFNRLRHWSRRNSRRGSRRNIAAHYDIGNAFYRLWLDRSMTYSSALYSDPDMTLEEAQQAKIDRAIDLLDVHAGKSVLEIGCGWGALAENVAANCHVTGLTLSSEQLAFAQDRLKRKGLADRADLRLQDYRDVGGLFDRVVSIEMLEAVGEAYWPTFFAKLRASLHASGKAVLQVITIDESRFETYRSTPDFIQKYIFPGGMLPTPRIIEREAAQAGLRLEKAEFFADSYARTLAEWERRFQSAWPAIRALGFDERFKRMWEYYLSYCEAGFASRAIDVGFYKLTHAPA